MEFADLVRSRRMTRRYRPVEAVDKAAVTQWLSLCLRAPSAGFTQGWDFVVLSDVEQRNLFWASTTDPQRTPDAWLQGMQRASVLVLCLSDPQRYLDRYAEPDKGWTDRDLARWPIPYWDVDTGMAALLLQLAALDSGWGSCFFGVSADRHDAVRATFGIPDDRRIVGVISLGPAAPSPTSPSVRRGRRPMHEVVHDGQFGTPWPVGRDRVSPLASDNGSHEVDV